MKRIRLFWWNEKEYFNKNKENYGDLLGKYIVENVSGKKVVWIHPRKWYWKNLWSPVYATVGSILMHVKENYIVWGSGVIEENRKIKSAKFLAVRGPETRRVLMVQGYNVPEVYGDPALLLPKYFNPEVKKTFKLGIVPHYVDYQKILEMYKDDNTISVIDLMTNDIEKTTEKILECESIISSSLHGIIVSHAYGIPAIWIRFSDKLFGDNIKFKDYFASVEIPYYELEIHDKHISKEEVSHLFQSVTTIPKAQRIYRLQEGLIASCPFIT